MEVSLVTPARSAETPQAIVGLMIGLPLSVAMWACIGGVLALIAF